MYICANSGAGLYTTFRTNWEKMITIVMQGCFDMKYGKSRYVKWDLLIFHLFV